MLTYAQVDASQPGTIHHLRLAFKKFRYMAEIVQPMIPGMPEKYMERMHKYQSTMGDIHDIEVFLSALADFSEEGADRFDPKPIRRFYEKRHTELVARSWKIKANTSPFGALNPTNFSRGRIKMILYIIRHAIAVEAAEFEGEDSQRPLTGKGKKKMQAIAQGLKELEIQLDLILTSPYLRATQTAEILAKVFDLSEDQAISTNQLTPTGYPDQLIEEINEKYGEAEHIAVIGHEPYLHLASMLITGDPNTSILLKKGGVCRLSI